MERKDYNRNDFPQANRGDAGNRKPLNDVNGIDYNPLNVHDSAVTEGGLQKHSGSSMMDFLQNMLASGRYDVGDAEFQWLFSNMWNQHNAEQSQNWAREDAYVAWLRSLESSKFNAKLGLETNHAARSQLYNQLIGLGMSPQAAMQMLSGAGSGSGSGGGSAPMAPTQQVAPTNVVGANQLQRITGAVSAVSTIFAAVSNFGLGVAKLSQGATQFKQNLEQRKSEFNRANWMNDQLYSAATSQEFKDFWNNAIQYAQSDCPESALTSPLAFRKHLASADGNSILNDEFNALRSKYGWAADSYFDSQFANVMNSQGQDISLKIKQAELDQRSMDLAIKNVNLKSLQTNLDWLSDKYDDYKQVRDVLNTKNIETLQWQLDRLRMVTNDPDLVQKVKESIQASTEIQAIKTQLEKLVLSDVFTKFQDSEFLQQVLTTNRLLEMCGVKSALATALSAGAAVMTKGKSLLGDIFNTHSQVEEPEMYLMIDGKDYYYDQMSGEYRPLLE